MSGGLTATETGQNYDDLTTLFGPTLRLTRINRLERGQAHNRDPHQNLTSWEGGKRTYTNFGILARKRAPACVPSANSSLQVLSSPLLNARDDGERVRTAGARSRAKVLRFV